MKKILTLCLKNIDLILDKGLCNLSWNMYRTRIINIREYHKLRSYLDKNLPKKRYPCNNYMFSSINDYCWKPGVKIGRIKWLKKHIS